MERMPHKSAGERLTSLLEGQGWLHGGKLAWSSGAWRLGGKAMACVHALSRLCARMPLLKYMTPEPMCAVNLVAGAVSLPQ